MIGNYDNRAEQQIELIPVTEDYFLFGLNFKTVTWNQKNSFILTIDSTKRHLLFYGLQHGVMTRMIDNQDSSKLCLFLPQTAGVYQSAPVFVLI